MRDTPSPRPVYKAVHRTLTICGVERRLFFLALLLGAATFNLFYSLLAGLLIFGGLLHSFTEIESDVSGIARYDAGAARQSYAMVDNFLTAAFEGKL